MLGTSFGEWISIRSCIVLFRYTPLLYITALTCLYLAYGEATWRLTATNVLLPLLVAEGLFAGLLYIPYTRRLNGEAVHPEPLSPTQRRALLDECLANVVSLEAYVRGWFLGADIKDIRRENLREFLLWAFFERGDISEDDPVDPEDVTQEVDGYVGAIEERLGHSLGDGRGPATSLRLTLDPIETAYRSLLWYAVIFIIDQATHVALLWHGFQYHARSPAATLKTFPPRPQELFAQRWSPAPDLGYWYRPHRVNNELPIVFFHGIGVGLWTYARFLADLLTAKAGGQEGVGIIAIEILPISFRLTSPQAGKTEFLRQMASILDHHDWDEFATVSHSYGSVLTTHMLESPELGPKIASSILIDPVTIMLHMPDVAYNFTRRRPRQANEWQLWYFASTDPGVAHCLGRHFFWRENILWKKDLLSRPGVGAESGTIRRRRAAVCLAGQDLIVDADTVWQYLSDQQDADPDGKGDGDETYDVKVLHFPKLDHAQVFDNPSECQRVVRLIKSYCRT